MAYVEQIAVHRTVTKCLSYIMNGEKTEEGILITAHGCYPDPLLAHKQFKEHRKKFGKDSGILAHHFVQSFAPGEVSIEIAHQIGNEWAAKFLSGYKYIVSTHIDKGHIHNHIVANSVRQFGSKYNASTETLQQIRDLSDEVCMQYELSIIKPKAKGKSYQEWKEEKAERSWKSIIKKDIDAAIIDANTFEDFLKIMRSNDYFIKHGENVTHMVFKKKGMARGSRGKTLGANYTEEAIKTRIMLKEYAFNYSNIKMRKCHSKYNRFDRELFRLTHQRATLSTNIALIVHMMAANGNRVLSTMDNHAKLYLKYKTETGKSIDEIIGLLKFTQEKGIKSRADINANIASLTGKLQALKYYVENIQNLQSQTEKLYNQAKFILKNDGVSEHEEKITYLKEKFKKLGIKNVSGYLKFIEEYDGRQNNIKSARSDMANIQSEIIKYEHLNQKLDESRSRGYYRFEEITDKRSRISSGISHDSDKLGRPTERKERKNQRDKGGS